MLVNKMPKGEEIQFTMPWSEDEYIVVNGLPLVYTVDQETEILYVRMPGGGKESAQSLRRMGYSVAMPKRFRLEYAAH